MRRALSLARAEVLHVVRDRVMLAQLLIVPVAQLLLLANAATFAIRQTPAYVVDLDRTPVSRGLVARFAGSGLFRIVGASASAAAADDVLRRGEATIVVTIPHDFESDLAGPAVAPVGIQLNADTGTAALIVRAYAAEIVGSYADGLAAGRGAAGTAPPIEVRTRSGYNASLSYPAYMVPGILVSLVTIIGTLLTAQNIAREKELGTLEQLNVTPITRTQFIAGKLLPFWAIGLLELTIGLAVGWLVFDVPVRGSLLLLYGVAGVYLVVALAIGLFISTVVETQQQAMFVTFFVLMVYLLMSGLFTPIDSMPRWVQIASAFTPVRHFVSIARAILVKGAGPADIARPLAALVVYAAVTMTLAIRQHRKTAA